jgi:hypothetical protein
VPGASQSPRNHSRPLCGKIFHCELDTICRHPGASTPTKATAFGPRGAGTGLPQPPAVPQAQAPTPQTSDPDVALVKSAIDSLRGGDADKATRIEATISDPVARKLVEWIILRSDRNGAGSARYLAFIAANPSCRPAGRSRGRSRKPRGPRGNLAAIAADSRRQA